MAGLSRCGRMSQGAGNQDSERGLPASPCGRSGAARRGIDLAVPRELSRGSGLMQMPFTGCLVPPRRCGGDGSVMRDACPMPRTTGVWGCRLRRDVQYDLTLLPDTFRSPEPDPLEGFSIPLAPITWRHLPITSADLPILFPSASVIFRAEQTPRHQVGDMDSIAGGNNGGLDDPKGAITNSRSSAPGRPPRVRSSLPDRGPCGLVRSVRLVRYEAHRRRPRHGHDDEIPRRGPWGAVGEE